MADAELPKNWEGAARWFIGGTIVFASGFEAVALFWDGKFIVSLGSLSVAIILMGILLKWEWLKAKMPSAATALTGAITDARLWAIVLVALAVGFRIPGPQAAATDWIYALPLFIGLLMFFAAWKYLRPPPAPPARTEVTADDQIERNRHNDRIRTLGRNVHLLGALKIAELEREIFRRLIEDAPTYPEDDDSILVKNDLLQERTVLLNAFLSKIGANLDGSRWYHNFELVMQQVEINTGQALKEGPPRLPDGANPYLNRDYKIALVKRFRAIQFLQHATEESRNSDLQYLPRFRDEQKLLDPRTFGG